VVTYADVLASEQQIHCDPDFTALRTVASDYTGANYVGLTESQQGDINALRIGGHYSNPRTRYAFVIKNPQIAAQMAKTVANGEMFHQTKAFDNFEQASDWAGL
jgi:hypothetical protein